MEKLNNKVTSSCFPSGCEKHDFVETDVKMSFSDCKRPPGEFKKQTVQQTNKLQTADGYTRANQGPSVHTLQVDGYSKLSGGF